MSIFQIIYGLVKWLGLLFLLQLVVATPFIPYYLSGFFLGDNIFTDILLVIGFIGFIFMFYKIVGKEKYRPSASFYNEDNS